MRSSTTARGSVHASGRRALSERTKVGGKKQEIAKARFSQKKSQEMHICAFCLGTDALNQHTQQPEPLMECSVCKSCGTSVE